MKSKKLPHQFLKFLLKKIYIAVAIFVFTIGLGFAFLSVNHKQDQYIVTQKIVFNAFKEAPVSYLEILNLDETYQKLAQEFSQYSEAYIKDNLKATVIGGSRIVKLTFTGNDEMSSRNLLVSAKNFSVASAYGLLMIPQGAIGEVGSVSVQIKPAESKKKIMLYFASTGLAIATFVMWILYDFNATRAKK